MQVLYDFMSSSGEHRIHLNKFCSGIKQTQEEKKRKNTHTTLLFFPPFLLSLGWSVETKQNKLVVNCWDIILRSGRHRVNPMEERESVLLPS